ncbi:GrpB family protein [Adlercreutzia sp. ZJ473]|uniref:GrpB family protein n=1 Tax=Adlercreutzia sp. ZJ473 TaxID=2722822 RepID=UPI001C12D320|nr:GrpB family protein [Adlercreutzia sp. ZJ473]
MFPIELAPYQPCWTTWFHQEKERVLSCMPHGVAVRISHIGSTAVEGIWAKPIIDMLLEADLAEFPRIKKALVAAGYLVMAEGTQRISLNRGYTPHGFAKRVFHLHLRAWRDDDEICFRDYLRAHPDVARAYEQLKLDLWKRYEFDRDGYTEAKTAFVTAHTRKAKEERAACSSR